MIMEILVVHVCAVLAVSCSCLSASKLSGEQGLVSESVERCPLYNISKETNAVKCERNDDDAYQLSLLPCYCLTLHSNSLRPVLGFCPYTCSEKASSTYIPLPVINITGLSEFLCKNFSRSGQMCGECDGGYAPAVYSYTLKCVNCTEYGIKNWLKYIGVAFGPQTLFFVAACLGRLSVTSGQMVGYVTISQLLATSIEIRFKVIEGNSFGYLKFVTVAYSIWNLDFFRCLYSPFCLNPRLTQLAAMALDYAVALYSVFLILVTCMLLRLFDKYGHLICCWRRAYNIIHRFYQAARIKNSIVDVFFMMLVVSYVKILNTTFELLLYTKLVGEDNIVKETAVFFAGHFKYLGRQHLPYAILALIMFTMFNIIPALFVTVYPYQCFHRCLNVFWKGAGVHNFMNDFYKAYKITPRDYRWFAALFLYLRIANLALLVVDISPVYFSLISILYLGMALLIGLIQPFKVQFYNVLNTFLFAVIAVLKVLEHTLQFSVRLYHKGFYVDVYLVSICVLYTIPPLYGLFVLIHHITPQSWLQFLRQKVLSVRLWNEERCFGESFAHRLSHANEYSHLINFNGNMYLPNHA